MTVGTKSLLFGVHAFWLHPFFVAWSWWKLYGFPQDLRLWVAFIVHDWGYWGKRDMDGPDGRNHVEVGGRIMETLFGVEWGNFTRRHSRHWAKTNGVPPSKLCFADKLVAYYEPVWMYLPRAWLSGELAEYMGNAQPGHTPRSWYRALGQYMKKWVEVHKNGESDTWTGTKEI